MNTVATALGRARSFLGSKSSSLSASSSIRAMSSNAKKVAVVLSGSGVQDGSEIHEAVFALNALSKQEANVTAFAPDIPQMHVVNHLTSEPMEGESRNVLVESARITRGAVTNITELKAQDFDCLVVPGGFGAAKNLCNAVEGPNMTVNPDVERVIQDFHASGKPMGFCCIAPVLPAKVIGNGVEVTLGGEAENADWPYAGMTGVVDAVGAKHVCKELSEVHVDAANKVVTSPAYMCGTAPMHKIEESVVAMTEKTLELA